MTRVMRVPVEHTISRGHVTILDLDKQGESLPKAIAVWTGFTRVTEVISSDSQWGTCAPNAQAINKTLHDAII